MPPSPVEINSRRRSFLKTMPVLGAWLYAGIDLSALASPDVVLRAGDQKGGLHALLEAADGLNGLNYEIHWNQFPAAAPLAEALNAGAVDFGPIGDAPLIFALAAGVPVKAFAVNRSDPYGTALLVRPDSGLTGAASLKGKKIATGRGSIGHYVALKALASAALKPEDVQFAFLPPAEAKLALTQGSVDAWAAWEPYTAFAETAGHARVLVNGRGLSSGLSFLVATEAALAGKRAALKDFATRVLSAQLWADQHPDQLATVLAREIGITNEAARLEFVRRAQHWIKIDQQVLDDQQQTADFYLSSGLLKQRLDVSQTFDSAVSPV